MRQGTTAVETARNQRLDELAGITGRDAERALRVKDLGGIIAKPMAEIAKTVFANMTDRNGSIALEADVVNANAVANTIADIIGLAFPVTAGETYWFRASILFAAAALTTGGRVSINGPAAPTLLAYRSVWPLTGGTEALKAGLSAYDQPAAAAASSATTAANLALIEGFIRPSVNGVLQARFASEVAGSAITIKKGSLIEWIRTA